MNFRESKDNLEFRLFVQSLRDKYVDSLAKVDHQGMLEASGGLCLVYAALGNAAAARKWADEFWSRWALVNPTLFAADRRGENA